jgi:glycosyltransferase involved in cell wall biosynthesis
MRISVVTVCFNARATIGQTIASVASQDWSDFEHLVIDGASTDGTAQLVRQMAHPRLRLISEPDQGLYDAMNKGLREATGTYVGFLNADDFFATPAALRSIGEAAERTGAECILGDTAFVDQQGRRKGRLYSASRFKEWWLRIGAMPPHPSFYARTGTLRDAGGFDTRYKIAADFDLIARLILGRKASWTRTGRVISCFRLGGVSTANFQAKLTIGREMADSLRRLGQPIAGLAVQLRYPLKLLQYGAGLFRTDG